MKPVDQTVSGEAAGDCFSACVASLLELPLAEVPYFNDDWPASFDAWLRARGFYSLVITIPQGMAPGWYPEGYYILGGQCARGSHAVVARGDAIVHDPNPAREGLTRWEDCTVLIPLDPARLPHG